MQSVATFLIGYGASQYVTVLKDILGSRTGLYLMAIGAVLLFITR